MLLPTFVNTVKQRGHELMVKGERSAIGIYFIFGCMAGFKGELDIIPTPPSLVDNYSISKANKEKPPIMPEKYL